MTNLHALPLHSSVFYPKFEMCQEYIYIGRLFAQKQQVTLLRFVDDYLCKLQEIQTHRYRKQVFERAHKNIKTLVLCFNYLKPGKSKM